MPRNSPCPTHLKVITFCLTINIEGNTVKKRRFPKRGFFALKNMGHYSGKTEFVLSRQIS